VTLVSSLPDRPLTLTEDESLTEDDSVLKVKPVRMVSDPDTGHRGNVYLMGAVFATDSSLSALQYSPDDRSWSKTYHDTVDPGSEQSLDSLVEAEEVIEESITEWEERGEVDEEVHRESDSFGEMEFRDSNGLARLLKQHYNDAT